MDGSTGESITGMMVKRKLNISWPEWNESLSVRLAWIFIAAVALLAVLGPFIANEKPYYCKLDGKTYFPLFSGISESTLSNFHPDYSPVDWKTTNFEDVWYAPIPYSHYTVDLQTGRNVSPFDEQQQPLRFRHWLGTDLIGRDVMAGMIRGCRISLLIGLGSMLLALLIGVPLGSIAAYWGNRGLRSGKKITLPLDHMVMGLVSIIDSFPGLFIVLLLLVIVPFKGWVVVMFAIALLRWPVMARYMRAEVYKMKESNYIKAVQVLNLPHAYILRKHIIPYAFRPVMISFIFGVSSAILAESSLSFLGIGLPSDELNWGRLLSQARNHFDAWWLVWFPGAAIFFTLLSLYTIGNAMQKKQYALGNWQ